MDENRQITIAEWQQWKQEIKDRLNQTVENFIAIGFRLRRIQETESYRKDNFDTLTDWAKAEFGLSESTVNRFMAINAKFTVRGEGKILLPEFAGISYSKLQEMLTLSDEDCKLITAGTTVKEIRELKQFNHDDERKYIPPAGQQAERTPLQECIWDFFRAPGNKETLDDIMDRFASPDYDENPAATEAMIAGMLSPSGNRTHRKGIVYLFMYDAARGVAYKLMTSPMPVKMTWAEFLQEMRKVYDGYVGETESAGSVWEAAYGSTPEKAEPEIPGQISVEDVIATSQEPGKPEESKHPADIKEPEAPKEPEKITDQAEIVEDANKSAIFKPAPVKDADNSQGGQVDSTGEEATNAETDDAGASGNRDDMPDSTGGDGAAGQPGDAAGVDRESEKDAGTDGDENPPHSVNTECNANSEMTDRDWNVLWEDMRRSLTAIRNFMNYTYDEKDLRHNRIPKSVLETKYKEAISVAAGFERILNGKKYSAQ